MKCLLLEGTVSPNIYIASPRGKIIQSSNISFIATLNDTGQYSCVANISLITIKESQYLYVYGKYVLNYISMYVHICMHYTKKYSGFVKVIQNGELLYVKLRIYIACCRRRVCMLIHTQDYVHI